MLHFCPQEAMAILAAIPLLRWLLARVVWWRARRKGYVDEQESCAMFEVRECRGCGTEIERKV